MVEKTSPSHLTLENTFPRGIHQILAQYHRHNEDTGRHDHEFYEIVLVLSGSAEYHRPGMAVRTVTAGSILILRPGIWHDYLHCKNLHLINILVHPNVPERLLAGIAPDLTHVLWSSPMATGGAVEITLPTDCFTRAVKLCEDNIIPDTCGDLERLGGFLLLTALMSQHLPVQSDGNRTQHPVVAQWIQRFTKEPAKPWTLSGMAQESNLDPSYLARRFRQNTGLSPMAYLSRLRAERAAVLLATTRESIASIATAVGWDSPKHFCRRFRQHHGENASGFRARNRKTISSANFQTM